VNGNARMGRNSHASIHVFILCYLYGHSFSGSNSNFDEEIDRLKLEEKEK